jgi:tetratricopeptide (TPR) repeat protein
MLSRIILILLLAPVLAGLACVPQPRPARPPEPPLDEKMAEVEPLLSERRYAEAIALLEQIAQSYPNTPLPLIEIGQIYLAQHRWPLAEDAFNRALARNLNDPAAKAGLAEVWFNQGRLSEALTAWQELAAARPDLPGVFTGLGRTYLWLYNFEAAQEAFAEQQRHRFDPQAQWFLAALEAPLDATAAVDKLQAISSPSGPDVATGPPEEVVTQRDYLLDLLTPLTADSTQVEVAKATGIALVQIEQWPLASHALTVAQEQSEQPDAETLAFLGYAQAQAGRPALDLLEQAHQVDPESSWPLYLEGLYLREQGAFKAAATVFEQALALDPENAAVYVEYGRTKAQQGDLGTAEAAYQAAVEVAADDLRFQKLLVEFYADRGYRVAEAGLPAAQALLEADEEDAETHALLGRMQFLAGNVIEGETALRLALELTPDLISARYHLARLLEAQGQAVLARQEYQRVVDWDRSGQYRQLALDGIQRLSGQSP